MANDVNNLYLKLKLTHKLCQQIYCSLYNC